MSNKGYLSLLLSVLMLMLTAGWNSACANPGSATSIDPCSLLSKHDARKILGESVKDARRSKDVGFAPGNKCSYLTSAPMEKRGGVYGVYVEVFDAATFKKDGSYFKSPTQYFQRSRKAAMSTGNKAKPVNEPGIGDAAYWQRSGGILNILDHGIYLLVSVHADFHIPPGPSAKVDAEESAAERKAARNVARTIVLPKLRHPN